jgi:hypothetical protein
VLSAKRVYRLYPAEQVQLQTKKRMKCAAQVRVPLSGATRPNQRWSMNFVSVFPERARRERVTAGKRCSAVSRSSMKQEVAKLPTPALSGSGSEGNSQPQFVEHPCFNG